MFTASKQQQRMLLEVSELDARTLRLRANLKSAESNSEIEELRSSLLVASEDLLNSHSQQEKLQADLAKFISDLELVDKRITQDRLKAKAVNSDRELKAVETEISSLEDRKSALEDGELEIIELLEGADATVSSLSQQRTSMHARLEEEMSKLRSISLDLSTQISELQGKRHAITESLDEQLLSSYERKALRSVSVGQTLGRDCSACRLAINGVEFDAMMALPEDSLPTCPNCDAFIIR